LQVYQCMRCGKLVEAAEAAVPHALALPTLQHVANNLRGWIKQWDGQRSLPEASAAALQQQLDSILQGGVLKKHSATLARSVLVVLGVLCGSQAALVRAVQGEVPSLVQGALPSIEDWLWFNCSLRCNASPAGVLYPRSKTGSCLSFLPLVLALVSRHLCHSGCTLRLSSHSGARSAGRLTLVDCSLRCNATLAGLLCPRSTAGSISSCLIVMLLAFFSGLNKINHALSTYMPSTYMLEYIHA
jgi:hypothetical protein